MKALRNNEHGLSLVEVTIMLLVLMLLTGVLAPSIFDFVNDAKWVKVKEDCEAIGLTVARQTRDVGSCLKFEGNKPCTKDNRVEVLRSDGPSLEWQSLGSSAVEVQNMNLYHGSLNWKTDRGDSMENQFVTNRPGYATPGANHPTYYPAGPQFNLGWRGAYLSPPIGPDPWGNMYLVNSAFLAIAAGWGSYDVQADGSNHGGGEGTAAGGWSYDTFCISAGPNGVYETPIGGNGMGGVSRMGDDFIFVISGGTR